MVADSLGEHLYTGDSTALIGYRSFDNNGGLSLLKQSPFDGVAGAYGLSIDLSDSFLYSGNNTTNTLSGFSIDKTTGDLQELPDSPYTAGAGPTSVAVVNNLL